MINLNVELIRTLQKRGFWWVTVRLGGLRPRVLGLWAWGGFRVLRRALGFGS